MNDLSIPKWTSILRDVIPDHCKNQRPFVCDGFGNPSDCDIIVIGKNPATPLGVNWRAFWQDTSGFDYISFAKCYEQPMHTRSKTRSRFSRFGDNGFRCIVANVCSEEGVEKSKKECDCNVAVLRVLLDNIPQESTIGVFAHGTEATAFITDFRDQCPNHWHIHTTCHLRLGVVMYVPEKSTGFAQV